MTRPMPTDTAAAAPVQVSRRPFREPFAVIQPARRNEVRSRRAG